MILHRTADPELVIFEFTYAGSASGAAFGLPCIFVVRVRNGRIIESRDYGDQTLDSLTTVSQPSLGSPYRLSERCNRPVPQRDPQAEW